jgi:hypothetical protein
MRRVFRTAAAALAGLGGGCIHGPLADNPTLVKPVGCEGSDPILVAPGAPCAAAYDEVFSKVLDTLGQYPFVVRYASRYDGHIVCWPRDAPGLEQPWKPGSPEFRERLYATLQTTRHFCEVFITPTPQGYLVKVIVEKQLEDLSRPTRSSAGAAAFRSDNTVERSFEVIDSTNLDPLPGEPRFIPKGRDLALEQELLRRIQKCW